MCLRSIICELEAMQYCNFAIVTMNHRNKELIALYSNHRQVEIFFNKCHDLKSKSEYIIYIDCSTLNMVYVWSSCCDTNGYRNV